MKCYECNTEWDDIEGVVFPRSCPFCGGNTAGFSTAKALRYIRKKYGNKMFLDKNKFVALLKDLLVDNPSDVKTISLIEMDDFHDYYIQAWKVNDMQKRAIVLKQARDYLINIGLRDEKIEQIDHAYQVAWGLIFEQEKAEEFKDKKDIYYMLGKDFLERGKVKEAAMVFSISEKAGNIKACIALCEMIKDGFVQAAVTLNKVCKDLSIWQRDIVNQIEDEITQKEIIEVFLFNIPDMHFADKSSLIKMLNNRNKSIFVLWLDYLDSSSYETLDSIFNCAENIEGRIISEEDYDFLSQYDNTDIFKKSSQQNINELKSKITKRIIDYAIKQNELIIALSFIYELYKYKSSDISLLDYVFIDTYVDKMPENRMVYSVALSYFNLNDNWERELELLQAYEQYDTKKDSFRIAKILIDNDLDCDNAYDIVKEYFVEETQKNNERTYIPSWAPSKDVIDILNWFLSKSEEHTKDLTVSWEFMASDNRYLLSLDDEELYELLLRIFHKKKWQKKINDLAIKTLSIISDSNEYQQSWNLLMLELLRNRDFDFKTFCVELIVKSIQSPKYMSDSLINQILVEEKKFISYDDCSRVTWECFYLKRACNMLHSNWDRTVVEKCILINQRQYVQAYQSNTELQNIIKTIRAVNYQLFVLIAVECIKNDNTQLGKELVSDIQIDDYLLINQEMSFLCYFIALFIDDEKQAIYKEWWNIDENFPTDIKYACNLLGKSISSLEKMKGFVKTCKKGLSNPYAQMGYIYERGLIGEVDSKKANEMYLKAAQYADYDAEIKVADMGIDFVIVDNILFAFPGSHKSKYDVVIPEDVKEIASYGMYGYNIKKVTIPGSVKKIGDHAFSECDDLEYVEIGNGTEHLARNCFNCGQNVKLHIYVPRSVKHIEEDVFSDNVIIHCKKTAPIKKYAEANNIEFVIE